MSPSAKHLYARLPALGGAEPPPVCPVCSSAQVPPESDHGLPPPEQWVYTCNGAYSLPDNDGGERAWEPYDFCGRVPTVKALAWLRDLCRADPVLSDAAAVLERAVREAPPYPPGAEPPLLLGLPPVAGERVPEVCPVCSAKTSLVSPGFHHYACGGATWVTSTRPGPAGAQVPLTWGGYQPCARPPIRELLLALEERGEPWRVVLQQCEEAMAAAHSTREGGR
ncbi:hypothetical protein [Sorangium sp. So ce1151]|uniref:hypothetical protein n=1 Tax=Sorangium sp. So ce1151 TaxID=3133332 RepID=UPI003F5EE9C7